MENPTPPDADEPPATPPASSTPSKRPWTILGRLSKAVREQNWFAVCLELVIVVLGVVIGFQVTSWGQSRTDRAQEQVYLRQLAADLDESLRVFAHEDSPTRTRSARPSQPRRCSPCSGRGGPGRRSPLTPSSISRGGSSRRERSNPRRARRRLSWQRAT